ncbi:phosphatase PAP2 family protein [Jeotgalibacillus proteolyticus]|uniref:PAP2 family protein n=1 Tax=Jeotgalibacillus proteolyticus TaxID=2082395 RepID=A0A2S5GFV5_9BACL|nr:phosphatase PAP2 family protein [Jeotgalibacillus proteolyticus]PPA71876.1 PAP2 family protein [Jeotgalibacillus proteolyticus]
MKWSRNQLAKGLKVTIPVGVIVLGLLLFVEIADELIEKEIYVFDDAVISAVQQSISPTVTQIATYITFLGNAGTLFVFTVLLMTILVLLKRFALAIFIGAVNLTGGGLNWGMKALFSRDRPAYEVLIEQGGYSFPSGHAMSGLIFYGSLAIVLILLLDKLWKGTILSFILSIIIFFIGLSRVYLGVHYPSDIVGGFALGIVWLTLCFSIYLVFLALRRRKDKKKKGEITNGIRSAAERRTARTASK